MLRARRPPTRAEVGGCLAVLLIVPAGLVAAYLGLLYMLSTVLVAR